MLDTALKRELVGSLLPDAVVLDSALSAHRQCDHVFKLEIPYSTHNASFHLCLNE